MKNLILFIFIVCYSTLLFGQERIKIGILAEMESLKSDSLGIKLKNEILSLIEHKNAVLFTEVFFNRYDPKLAKAQYDSLVAEDCDIIIAFGPTNALMFYEENVDFEVPTILAGFVNQDFIELEENTTSQIDNFTYYVTPFSMKEDVVSFKTLANYKNLGIVMDDYLLQSFPMKEKLDEIFSEIEADYTLIPVGATTDQLEIPLEVDAIYFNSTSQLEEEKYKAIINQVNALQLPSLSGYGVRDLELGVMATNQPSINFDQIFRRIALTIESALQGQNLKDLSVEINYDNVLTINLDVAEYVGITFRNSELVKYDFMESNFIGEGQSFSLKNLMYMMLHQNLTLEAERKSIDIKNQEVRLSKANYLPEVGVNAGGTYVNAEMAELSFGQNPEYSMTGNVQLKQTIYSADASANIKISKLSLEAQREDFNALELDQVLEVGMAYYNTLIYEANKSIQLKNLHLTKENLKLAEENLAMGVGGKSDLLRFQSQLAQNTQGMIEAKNAVAQSHLTLNKLLNLPMDDRLVLKDSLLLGVQEQNDAYGQLMELLDQPRERYLLTEFLIEEALINSPELMSLLYNKESVERNYKLNKNGRFIPTVALQGQYNQFLLREGAGTSMPVGFPSVPLNNYNVGLNVSIPIFQQNTRNINQQKSKIQMDQLVAQKNDYEQNVERMIHENIIALINELTNIEIAKANKVVAEENLEISQSEYANGIIPVIQLIDAQNNLLENELAFITAQYNYFIVSLQIQRGIGYYFLLNSEESNQAFYTRAAQFIQNN
ncbi:TolC family protein [Flammeovirga aprica]|uniref:TolC family protein n=1 Tax=Flammeovirga aprica JL-4 TaxID=694437 RepID=A0A7X9S1F7_9BACT|nr:TolC family protein [Flammeovirga aprica]NME72608.1 TolC family protein [Flammeovirga aprica JL-4]